MHMSTPLPQGVSISGRITPEFAQILTPEALALIAKLHRAFGTRRAHSLARRAPAASRRPAPRPIARGPRGAATGDRRRQAAGFSARNERDPRRRLEDR